jgi:sec-independent protein translocase protein TatA
VVALILFGGKKLPEFAKGLAKGLRIFKEELHSVQHDLEEEPTPPAKENGAKLQDPLPSPQQEPKKQ